MSPGNKVIYEKNLVPDFNTRDYRESNDNTYYLKE